MQLVCSQEQLMVTTVQEKLEEAQGASFTALLTFGPFAYCFRFFYFGLWAHGEVMDLVGLPGAEFTFLLRLLSSF